MGGIIKPGAHVIGLIQQISTGGTLNGTLPTTAAETGAVLSAQRKTWAADVTGGLFDFGHTQGSVTVSGIEMVLGGQTAYNVYITDGVNDATANDVLLQNGTNAATVFMSKQNLFIYLLPGQKIRITTTGTATVPWRITVKGSATFNEGGLFA